MEFILYKAAHIDTHAHTDIYTKLTKTYLISINVSAMSDDSRSMLQQRVAADVSDPSFFLLPFVLIVLSSPIVLAFFGI